MSLRKRVRTSFPDSASPGTKAVQPNDASVGPAIARSANDSAPAATAESSAGSIRESRNKPCGWHGSWPRAPKSAASTQLATETILGGTLQPKASVDFTRFDMRKTATGVDALGANGPLALTGCGISPTTTAASLNQQVSKPPQQQHRPVTPRLVASDLPNTNVADGPDVQTFKKARGFSPGSPKLESPAQGWFSWLGSSAYAETAQSVQSTPTVVESATREDERQIMPESAGNQHIEPPMQAVINRPETSGRMWSYWWSSDGLASSTTAQSLIRSEEAAVTPVASPGEGSRDVGVENGPCISTPVPAVASASMTSLVKPSAPSSTAPVTTSAGSTWAFWSRDTRQRGVRKLSNTPEQGEIAIIGERSEIAPKPATDVEVKESSSKASSTKDELVKEPAARGATGKGKRLRPRSMEADEDPPAARSNSSPNSDNAAPKAATVNLLLPPFQSTFYLEENTSILRRMRRFLWRTQRPPANRVFLATYPLKIKKAVAIGVHGLFPAAYLRPMIGHPTGTSIRFANHAAEAVRRWADAHNFADCEIEKIALEGEGKIAERVENLWKLLLNWADHIRSADFIILASHSQGVPVGMMLLAKLIDLGIVTTPRIGVCAMAGVSLGPFPDYKSGFGILMGSAGELWDFGNPESEVSKRYEQALKTVLEYGVRITYIGSLDDQVVPLESAIYSPARHPYIYRAVFVDSRIHAPDFIAHLVGFACKLRNLGISDHGLIRELSVPLAGSLYSGEGHSRVYDDPQVYDLGIRHALETADIVGTACEIQERGILANPNPYHLPWIMRGLLEEDCVKTELHAETEELLAQFDEWKPVTKALKDVKYRLEAVRSRL